MARKDMVISEINRLYAVIEEVRSEYDKLNYKMAKDLVDDGDLLSNEEHAQYLLLYHLIKVYNGGNER